jgi:hypothetical protein
VCRPDLGQGDGERAEGSADSGREDGGMASCRGHVCAEWIRNRARA